MKVSKVINVKKPVSEIKYFDGIVGVVDSKNTFRMFNVEDYELIGGFKINLPENSPLENTIAISPYGNYLAIAIKGKRKTTIWDIKNKKLLHTLGWHKGEVLSVSFDYDENHLLTGGMDGRAYMWSINTGSMIASLPPHPDYILANAFSLNSLWVATGSYDRLITITNSSAMNIHFRKKSHRGAITKIIFLKNFMISGDKTGELIIWDYTKGKIINRLPTVADLVIDMVADEKEEYLFVITKEKKVYLFDLKKQELISDNFIKLPSLPSKLCYVSENSTLWVGLLDGSIYIFNLFEDLEKFKDYLNSKEYGEAYNLADKNPFIKRLPEYKKLEEIWDKTLENAYALMEAGNVEKAKEILKPFLLAPQKRTIIQNILKDFREFEKFKQAVLKGKYPLAYSLAAMYPSFKETKYYKKMEDDFKKVFIKAKELIKMRGQEDNIRKLLLPFRGVSQKTSLIQALFNDKQIYDLLRKLLQEKKFDEFFVLVERNPFLYETPEYESAMKYGEKLNETIKELLRKGEFKKVIEYANMLAHFPKYKERANNYIDEANAYLAFVRALGNNNYDLVEKLSMDYPFLFDTNDYKEYKKKISTLFIQAEKFSAKGDLENALAVIEELLNSSVFKTKITNLIKVTYLNQLMNELKGKRNKQKIEKGINNYISLFGYDNEIEDIVKIANKLKLNPTIESLEQTRMLNFKNLPKFIWDEF